MQSGLNQDQVDRRAARLRNQLAIEMTRLAERYAGSLPHEARSIVRQAATIYRDAGNAAAADVCTKTADEMTHALESTRHRPGLGRRTGAAAGGVR